MERILFIRLIIVLIFVLIVVGCTNKIPETSNISEMTVIKEIIQPGFENETTGCEDCRLNCSNAIRTDCIDGKCECYYSEINQMNNTFNNKINNKVNNNVKGQVNDQVKNINNGDSDFDKQSISFFDSIPSCEERDDLLNVSPLKYGDFQTITPLGNLNPSGHTFPTDHIYMMIKRADNNNNNNNNNVGTLNVPLYMPGDSWITEITVTEHLSEQPILKDYDFVFYPCKELKFRFGHVTSLSEELLLPFNVEKQCDKEYETGNKRFKRCSVRNLNLKVSSGKMIGTVGGNPNQNALDIWGTDLRVDGLEFANQNRWYNEIRHTICPLNYFVEKEKEKLYSLLAGFDNNQRIIEPRCGTIEQDIKGTAQGVWFVEGTKNTYPEDSHLALVLNNINPAINVFSIGTSIPTLDSKTYSFNPEFNKENVNVAFSKVKPGNVYCYEQNEWDFTIILELVDNEHLRIEKQSGSKCNSPFKFVNGVLFER